MPKDNNLDANNWYKPKRYPHIGIPYKNHDLTISYIKNPKKIAVHGFMPFIHKVITTNRYRKEYEDNGKLKHNGKRVNKGIKERDIHYPNHLDSNIYAYYSSILHEKYEFILEQKNLENVVTAYRKIPVNPLSSKPQKFKKKKNNIHFADDIFRYIKRHGIDKDIVAITFDIEKFFPSLDHKILKNQWCEVLGVNYLPKDHYNVFKSITKFSYVEEQRLFNLFKDKILVQNNKGQITSKPVNRIQHLYNKRAVAYCKMKDIHIIRKNGLIHTNKYVEIDGQITKQLRTTGICQGSAISATLANMYMLDFDKNIDTEIKKLDGIYRRYSDDMVVVCPKRYKDKVINLFSNEIDKIKLKVNDNKTQVFHFRHIGNRLVCEQEFNGSITQYSINRNFEYLGFSFDGKNVYLKTASLAKYYRKMKTGVRRSRFYSNKIKNHTRNEIFRKRLYKRYSYIGSKRGTKYKRVQGATNKWQLKPYTRNWGNYITYAKLAHSIMRDYSKIDSQIKNHWKNLNKEINRNK